MSQLWSFGIEPTHFGSMLVFHYCMLKLMFLQWKQHFKNSCLQRSIGHTFCHYCENITFSDSSTVCLLQRQMWFWVKQSWNAGASWAALFLLPQYSYNDNIKRWRTNIAYCTPWAQTRSKNSMFRHIFDSLQFQRRLFSYYGDFLALWVNHSDHVAKINWDWFWKVGTLPFRLPTFHYAFTFQMTLCLRIFATGCLVSPFFIVFISRLFTNHAHPLSMSRTKHGGKFCTIFGGFWNGGIQIEYHLAPALMSRKTFNESWRPQNTSWPGPQSASQTFLNFATMRAVKLGIEFSIYVEHSIHPTQTIPSVWESSSYCRWITVLVVETGWMLCNCIVGNQQASFHRSDAVHRCSCYPECREVHF